MEDILKTILISALSSGLVFWFSQRAIKAKDKQDGKKKLNKLLFHLLLLKKEVSTLNGVNAVMTALLNKIKLKLINEFQIPEIEINEQFSPEFSQTLSTNLKQVFSKTDIKKINKIKENTEILINELSETNPIFALDLENFYNIDEKTSIIENSFNLLDFNKEIPDLPKMVMPEVERKLNERLDNIIYETALKIDNKTYQETISQVEFYNSTEVDNEEVNDLFNVVMEPLLQSLYKNDLKINQK